MSYELWVIVTGSLVGITCGITGTFLIVRRLAMLSDAISHSVLLGIVGAYLVSHSLNGVYMLIGAAIVGLGTAFFVQLLHSKGIQEDAAIGVVFTTLFAIGVILISIYGKTVHLDVEHALMGEIAFVPWDTLSFPYLYHIPKAVFMLSIVLFVTILIILLFYKELKITSFDPQLALSIGIPVGIIHYVLMGLVSFSTVASFDAVGAVLVVSMLITPGATAYLLTESFEKMIGLSALFGILIALIGYEVAVYFDVSISGSMAVTGGILFLLSFLFSPTHGIVIKTFKKPKHLP